MIRLALVDDHHIVRRGLRSYLEAFPDIVIAGDASSGEEALSKVGDWQPDVILLDLLMPGGTDGIETARRLREVAPQTQIVILTAYGDDVRVPAALRAGVIGYVRKDAAPELLLAAVRSAARGQALLDPAIAGSVLQDFAQGNGANANLSERELEVLRLLARGYTNREISDALILSVETIKSHVTNILGKLGQSDRTQAVVQALKQGLLLLDEIELKK
ncbi:MAG: response regulator transcription factor [Anaerolineae bacterium]|nr:response regulator transcription factor [Anaerolineae bacterium]